MVDKTSIPNQTVNLEASNRSTAVTPKSIFGANKATNFLQAPAVQDLDPHLKPNYNFENFIEGYSLSLIHIFIHINKQKAIQIQLRIPLPTEINAVRIVRL